MDRIPLKAEERTILGKKVKNLRKQGLIPAHVFGKKVETEHVSVPYKEFLKVFRQAGETGLIDLKIGAEKVKPVMIRGVARDAMTDKLTHIDFYQVNLAQKVTVPVPFILTGDAPELVGLGEAIVLQTLNEVSVEALPSDLVENIEINISSLKNIGDSITIAQLSYDHSKLTLHAEPDAVVAKLAPAVSAETQQLLEEQAAETAEAVAETEAGAEKIEGEEATEAEAVAEGSTNEETKEEVKDEKPQE